MGNRVRVARSPDWVSTATYDAADQLASLAEPDRQLSFGYDGNGNLVERQVVGGEVLRYSWDPANRLRSLVDGAGVGTRYSYDGDGALYREEGINLGRPSDARGNPASLRPIQYSLDLGQAGPGPRGALSQVLVATDSGDAAQSLYGVGRIASFSGNGARYFQGDVRGTVRSVLDEGGKLVGIRTFDPWGVPHPGDPLGDAQGPLPLTELFGYTGERQDGKTGLIHLRARWYDPGIGRFLSVDPFPGLRTLPISLHPYLYAHANPTTLRDPSGRGVSHLMDDQTCFFLRKLNGPQWDCIPLGTLPPAVERQEPELPGFENLIDCTDSTKIWYLHRLRPKADPNDVRRKDYPPARR